MNPKGTIGHRKKSPLILFLLFGIPVLLLVTVPMLKFIIRQINQAESVGENSKDDAVPLLETNRLANRSSSSSSQPTHGADSTTSGDIDETTTSKSSLSHGQVTRLENMASETLASLEAKVLDFTVYEQIARSFQACAATAILIADHKNPDLMRSGQFAQSIKGVESTKHYIDPPYFSYSTEMFSRAAAQALDIAYDKTTNIVSDATRHTDADEASSAASLACAQALIEAVRKRDSQAGMRFAQRLEAIGEDHVVRRMETSLSVACEAAESYIRIRDRGNKYGSELDQISSTTPKDPKNRYEQIAVQAKTLAKYLLIIEKIEDTVSI